jgi:hypothetical protein
MAWKERKNMKKQNLFTLCCFLFTSSEAKLKKTSGIFFLPRLKDLGFEYA